MSKDKSQMLILIVLMTLGGFIALQFIFVGPAKVRLAKVTEELGEKGNDLKQKQGKARQYPALVKEKEQLLLAIEAFENDLIGETEFDFFRSTLRDMGSEYEVKILQDRLNILPDKSKSVFQADPAYTEKEIRLSIQGRYHDFGGFLGRVEDSSPFRKVMDFSITSGRQQGTGKTLKIEATILSLLLEKT